MTGTWHPAAWIPDRPPRKIEVALALFFTIVLVPAQFLVAESISPSAAAAGLLVTLLVIGPVASSRLGRRIGDRFRSIGIAWRALLLAVFVVPLFVAGADVPRPVGVAGTVVPHPVGIGFVLGSMAAILALLWAQLLRFRTVSAS